MKILLTLIVLLFSSSVFAERILTNIDDGHNINEVDLLIEEIDECTNVTEVEKEIKYVLLNSHIKISKESPYKLYVNMNFDEIEAKTNFCFGSINFQIFSLTKLRVSKKIIHWEKGTITIKSYPWDIHIRYEVNRLANNAVVWIKEN